MLFLSNTIMSRVSIGEHSFIIYNSYQCANTAPARPAALPPSMNPHMQTYFSHIFSTIYMLKYLVTAMAISTHAGTVPH